MGRILSPLAFIISASLILLLGLGVLGGLYYVVNSQTSPVSPIGSYQQPVTSQPSALNLDITSPDDSIVVFEKQILVSGKTAPNSQILISSESTDAVVNSKKDGTFSNLTSLGVGNNQINITVFDASGDEKQASRTVFYSKEEL